MIAAVLLILLFKAATTLAVAGDATACPNGWMPFRESCYKFVMNSVHFTEAEHYCRQHNSHLIRVDDADENTFIKDLLRDLKTNDWHMGLTDEDLEGTWKWFDTDTEAEFTDFNPKDTYHTGQDCAVFYASYDFLWADVACTHSAMIICETQQVSPGCEEAERVIG